MIEQEPRVPKTWGDTYGQYFNGGGFDISGLPNGRYYIRTEVDPGGSILEVTTANDTQDRLVRCAAARVTGA